VTDFAVINQLACLSSSGRLPYVAPVLIELGELRDITLGASPGIGDSGGTQPQRCPGCP
jgi:hypothetical protein